MYNAYTENTLVLNPDLCNGCQMCIMVCPHGVFEPTNKIVSMQNHAACMECGACMINCSTGAINVDSGVGCATAMFMASLRGQKVEECGCG